jgi:hypothetical protein
MVNYEDLLKIKGPVKIEVESKSVVHGEGRIRILYPNGRCFYKMIYWSYYHKSCFDDKHSNLVCTVKKMSNYDSVVWYGLRLVKIEKASFWIRLKWALGRYV